jgi:hypothetical protein
MVTVNILLDDKAYGEDETLTRGYRSAKKPETVQASMGEDLYMEATLEEDEVSPARDAIALANNVRVRVVAYNGTSVASTALYRIVDGKLTTNSGLSVNTGITYTFVAYSYNSATAPTYPGPTITVDPANDLLWGSTTKLIQATDYNVSITMDHLFAQVRVKATAVDLPNIRNLTTISVSPGNAMDLTIRTGSPAQNAATAAQSIPSWSGNSASATSGYITVNTGAANPIYVHIGSVTIQGYTPSEGITIKFTKALTAGTSYTLAVNIKRTRWAKSNIYWDPTLNNGNGALTFDTQEGHEDYQGVFFKWGSLIGIAPMGSANLYENVDPPLYIPPVGGGNWDYSKTVSSADSPWADAGTWDAIPLSTYGDMSDSYADYRGDICRYLRGSTWRLPNINEFGSISDYVAGVTSYMTNPNDATGRGLLGERGSMYQGAFFPHTTYMSNGRMVDSANNRIGQAGDYWSRTPYGSGVNAGGCLFTVPFMGESATSGADYRAMPIRCIKN